MRRTLRSRRLARTLAALTSFALASPALAADRLWTDPVGGSWQDAANWSGGVVPLANDRAIFDLDDTGYTVTFTNSVLDVGLLVGNDRVTLDLFGAAGNLTFTQSDVHPFMVGETAGDDGRLTVTRSGSFNTSAATARTIGNAINSSGRLVLTNNAVWVATNNNAQEINVGLDGNGVVILQDGARGNSVGTFHLGRNATASGSFTVTGPASSFSIQTLRVGTGGTGTVLVENGASLSVGGATMALGAGASGSLTVNGPGSDFSIGSFNIGNAGDASVTVSNGARLTGSAGVSAGANGGGNGSILVTGLGSRMSVAQHLNLGDSQTGPASASLTISAGGRLTNASSTLSRAAGNTAHALVTGPGSSWELATDLFVGDAGDASLTVSDGASVSAPAQTTFSRLAGSTSRGRVTGPGSALRATGGLTIGGLGSASLVADGGALLDTASITIAAAAASRSSLDLSGPGTLLSATGGIVLATSGIGTMTVSNGARVFTEEAVTVASGASSVGSLRVSGPGTLFEASSQSLDGLTIAANGNGALVVEDGAIVRAPAVFAGSGAARGASITVTGPRSTLAATDTLGGIGIGGNINGNTIIFGSPSTVALSEGATLTSAAHIAVLNGSVLAITSGATASAAAKVSVTGSLLLIDDGTLSVGTGGLDNLGEIRLAGDLARINGTGGPQSLANSRLISGNGRIALVLSNAPTGEVRVATGDRLHFAASVTNSGNLNLLGGTLEFSGLLTNTAAGRISGRGTLIAPTLDNEGRIHLSSGVSDFFTILNNTTPNSEVIVSGGASATFHSPVNNVPGSEFRVSQNSTATFFAHVTGSNFFSGPGTVNFEAGASVVGALSVGSARVAPLASLDTNGFRTNSLTVEGTMRVLTDSPVSRTASLTILDDASLDLANNDLVIDNGDLAATRSHFTSGRLFTSAATPITTLAIVKNDAGAGIPLHTTFSGESVDASDVLVKYTYHGDANLDGRVGISDFFAADRGRALRLTGWQNGDFNHSGGIPDAADFMLLDRAFLAQGSPLSSISPSPTLPLSPSATSASPVPEPAAAALVLLPTLLARRRINRAPARP